MNLRALILAAALFSANAFGGERQLTNGEPASLAADRAYVLVRAFEKAQGMFGAKWWPAPILIRVLDEKELEQARALASSSPDNWQDKLEPNVVPAAQQYAEIDGEMYLLTSLKPGTYVIASIGSEGLCMGTVEFDAKPGMITDLGTMLSADDDKPTDIPELQTVVSGKPMGFGHLPQAVAIRMPNSSMELPDTLRKMAIVPANYRAAGPFPNYLGIAVGRLAPIPGVLAYNKDGHIIDLKATSKAH